MCLSSPYQLALNSYGLIPQEVSMLFNLSYRVHHHVYYSPVTSIGKKIMLTYKKTNSVQVTSFKKSNDTLVEINDHKAWEVNIQRKQPTYT